MMFSLGSCWQLVWSVVSAPIRWEVLLGAFSLRHTQYVVWRLSIIVARAYFHTGSRVARCVLGLREREDNHHLPLTR